MPVEKDATDQLLSLAKLPIVHSHVAAMPDMHLGKGACVGCVVATIDAIIPSAVGVVGQNFYYCILAELLHRAPLERKYGNPSVREHLIFVTVQSSTPPCMPM